MRLESLFFSLLLAWSCWAQPAPINRRAMAIAGLATGPITCPCTTNIFSNNSTITINDNTTATPYPSVINVAGISGSVVVTQVVARLNGFSHTYPGDVVAMLVSPSGLGVYLLNNTGGGTDASGTDLQFEDDGNISLQPSVSGTYYPAVKGFTTTIPSGPSQFGAGLNYLAYADPNGDWNLYVLDNSAGDSGTISGGWQLMLKTIPCPVTNMTAHGISNLFAYWKLDDTTTNQHDTIGINDLGSQFWQPGSWSDGFHSRGVNVWWGGGLETASSTNFNFVGQDFTVRFWYRPDATFTAGVYTQNLLRYGGIPQWEIDYGYDMGNGVGTKRFRFRDFASSGGISNVITAPVTEGIWHHVVAYCRWNDAIGIAVDGGAASETSIINDTGNPSETLAVQILVGGGTHLGPFIDEIAIWTNRAFTASDITEDYNDGNGRFLVGHETSLSVSMDQTNACLNSSFTGNLIGANGSGSYSFILYSSSLPGNFSISGSSLTGTATNPGVYPFAIHCVDSTNAQTLTNLSLKVCGIVSASPLPNFFVGISNYFQLVSTGIDSPNFSITASNLPTGLSMDANGLITGTASSAQTNTITVTVSNLSIACSKSFDVGSQQYALTNLPFVRVVMESDKLTFNDQAGTTPAGNGDSLRRWSNAPTLAVYGSVKDANAAPTYFSSGGPNGLPYIRFLNASQQALITDANHNFSAPNTFLVVGKSTQSSIAGSMIFDSSGDREAAYYWSDNLLYTYSDGAGPTADDPNTNWQVYTFVFASGEWVIRTNGVQAASSGATPIGYDWGIIGNDSSYSFGFNGYIAAFILCNTNLNGSVDLITAENLLKSKYGL